MVKLLISDNVMCYFSCTAVIVIIFTHTQTKREGGRSGAFKMANVLFFVISIKVIYFSRWKSIFLGRHNHHTQVNATSLKM